LVNALPELDTSDTDTLQEARTQSAISAARQQFNEFDVDNDDLLNEEEMQSMIMQMSPPSFNSFM
jgi:Ca2+-binding EF-hand superfamily protein